MSDGDSYTEVTSEGYFSRLGGSIVGFLIGLILVPAAVVLLWWNEGRAVHALDALASGARQVVEVNGQTADPAAEGKLVHLTGTLAVKAGARDPLFGLTQPDLVRLKRIVQMYQWKETEHEQTRTEIGGQKVTEKTYTYTKEWSPNRIASEHFKHQEGHVNPPISTPAETFAGQEAKLGPYRLAPAILNEIQGFTDVTPPDGATPPDGWHRDGTGFARGDVGGNPMVGDLRVSFEGVSAQTYSAIAALSAGTLTVFHGTNDYEIGIAKPGVASAAELFKARASEEKLLSWILRGAGFLVLLIGFLLIAQPVATVFAFLPFLEGIAEAGAFLIALTISVPLTLVIIAIAWIAHRPLIGGGLLAGALVLGVLLRMMHPRRQRVA